MNCFIGRVTNNLHSIDIYLFNGIKFKLMDKWKGKNAVVTGASAGIGISIVKSLVSYGVNVIGLARRAERVEVSLKLYE